MQKQEWLLEPNPKRFVLLPIEHDDIWAQRKLALAAFWTADEIDLAQDISDWRDKLNDKERHFIKHVLAFFAASDGIVNENLVLNFYNEVQIPEARSFYAAQIQIEDIHSETYSLLIDTYIQDAKEKQDLFDAIETMPCVQKKAQWALKWITSQKSFAHRLVAFAIVEGVFFSGSFCAIYWIKQRGLMQGLAFSNEKISTDEALHCEFACLLYSKLEHTRLSQADIHEMFSEAIAIEKEFVSDALPVSLLGMNAADMCQYIEFVADFWLDTLGYDKLSNATNPFPFMDMISLQGKTNFFERRVGDYQKAGVMADRDKQIFSLDEDF